jgi:hypothetical protein
MSPALRFSSTIRIQASEREMYSARIGVQTAGIPTVDGSKNGIFHHSEDPDRSGM